MLAPPSLPNIRRGHARRAPDVAGALFRWAGTPAPSSLPKTRLGETFGESCVGSFCDPHAGGIRHPTPRHFGHSRGSLRGREAHSFAPAGAMGKEKRSALLFSRPKKDGLRKILCYVMTNERQEKVVRKNVEAKKKSSTKSLTRTERMFYRKRPYKPTLQVCLYGLEKRLTHGRKRVALAGVRVPPAGRASGPRKGPAGPQRMLDPARCRQVARCSRGVCGGTSRRGV